MNELEQIRTQLHLALEAGRPREEILRVSRHLDRMIVAGMKSTLDKTQPPFQARQAMGERG